VGRAGKPEGIAVSTVQSDQRKLPSLHTFLKVQQYDYSSSDQYSASRHRVALSKGVDVSEKFPTYMIRVVHLEKSSKFVQKVIT
jgi:hypothetical protein